jgi:predicted Na+-dependent transporter
MLPRVILVSIPVLLAFGASAWTCAREKTLAALVQLLGAFCLLGVVFAHFAEALSLLPSMGWGRPKTAGHYIDLVNAIAGVSLLTIGYFSRWFLRRKISP